jgi:hypothetical protein
VLDNAIVAWTLLGKMRCQCVDNESSQRNGPERGHRLWRLENGLVTGKGPYLPVNAQRAS